MSQISIIKIFSWRHQSTEKQNLKLVWTWKIHICKTAILLAKKRWLLYLIHLSLKNIHFVCETREPVSSSVMQIESNSTSRYKPQRYWKRIIWFLETPTPINCAKQPFERSRQSVLEIYWKYITPGRALSCSPHLPRREEQERVICLRLSREIKIQQKAARRNDTKASWRLWRLVCGAFLPCPAENGRDESYLHKCLNYTTCPLLLGVVV